MEIKYDLQPKDIWAYFKNVRTFSEKFRYRYSYIKYIFWPLGLYLIQFSILLLQSAPLSYALIHPLFYTFIGAFIIGPLLMELLFYVKYKMYVIKYERLKNKKIIFLVEGCKYTFTEGTNFYEWANIHRVVEEETHYFIYINDNKCIILPKDCLELEENQHVKQILKEGVEPYIEYQTPPVSNKLVKIGVTMMAFFFCLLLFNNWLENSSYFVKQSVYDLFEGIENNDDPKELIDSELTLKDSVTMGGINKVGRKVYTLSESNQNQKEWRQLSNLLIRANELVIERDQITQVYSGESEYWQMGDITFKIMPDHYVDVHYATNQRANSQETQTVVEFLNIEVHMTLNEEIDILLNEVEFSRSDIDFTEGKGSGLLGLSDRYQLDENSQLINADGAPININDITGVYMVIQWKSKNTDKIQEEKIIYSPVSY